MPMHSLSKVQKQIKQKKSSKSGTALHANSRNAQRLRRAVGRDDKIARIAHGRAKRNQPLLDRVAFFQQLVSEKGSPLSLAEIQAAVNEYLGRNNEALQDLKAQRRPGRPSSTQEDVLKHHRDVEEKELASGFWMPDLQHAENYPRLAEWNGEWTALAPLYFCRFLSSGESKPSKFPPDSLS